MWAKEWEEALDEGEKRRLSFLLLVWSSFYYYNTIKEKMRESILQRLVRGGRRGRNSYIFILLDTVVLIAGRSGQVVVARPPPPQPQPLAATRAKTMKIKTTQPAKPFSHSIFIYLYMV